MSPAYCATIRIIQAAPPAIRGTAMSVPLKRYHFNVAEYYRMADAGILKEDDRVELIEGEIIEMSPAGSRHAACVDRFNRLLNRLAGDTAIVRVQSPVRLNDF